MAQGSLCVCAVVAELGRYFVDEHDLRAWMAACQIAHDPRSMDNALEAARIMRGCVRNQGPRERTAPDFLIGAHAMTQAKALLRTDAGFFRHCCAGLRVVTL